jgi:D-alanyl-D-alanine carboxypeptidase (penicillin-binding protein 5/6)
VSRHGWAVRRLSLVGVAAIVGSLLAGPAVAAEPTAAPPTAAPPCAIGDRQPIAVPSPSPLPEHKPSQITIGGDALAGTGLAVAAGAPALPAELAATSWLVADLDSGEVLGACGAHRMQAPASVQKLLLAATVLPKLNPTDTVLVTPEDLDFGAEWDSKTVPLQAGQTYTVEDLFLGLLLRSGNDAANALARIAGGERGVAGTIEDMNAEARHLGAWDTHAATPSGLDGPGQVTSAYDLALIFRAAFANENFRRWVRTPEAVLSSQTQIEHDNWEFVQYPGSLGGKAGYTDIARHSYVGAFERDGRRLVATALGAEVMPLRSWQQVMGLLDWGFAQDRDTSVGQLVEPGEAQHVFESQQPSAPQPAGSRLGVVAESEPPTRAALWLAAGVGGAAVASLGVIVFSRRRRGRLAGPLSVAPPTASTPEPPASEPPTPPEPPTPS